jgi:hypothetical protein
MRERFETSTKNNYVFIQFPPVHANVDKLTDINYAFSYFSYDIDHNRWYMDVTDPWGDFGMELSTFLLCISQIFSSQGDVIQQLMDCHELVQKISLSLCHVQG